MPKTSAAIILALGLTPVLVWSSAVQAAALHSGPTTEVTDDLVVYTDVPGLAASDKYSFRVRTEGAGEQGWHAPFAFITACGEPGQGNFNYFPELAHWTNTYINFEMRRPVEVEISKLYGSPIETAVVHPAGKTDACEVRHGKAYLKISHPCLITVDINGQMDDQDTGYSRHGRYSGPPIHTLTIFANLFLENRPHPDDRGVYAVKPGEKPPSVGRWQTLYFLPGVHNIGIGFPVMANKRYYIPGDAIVYGTFHSAQWSNGHDIHIFGYGTLSGARIPHPKLAVPHPKDAEAWTVFRPVNIAGAFNTSVEGITIADSAYHSILMSGRFDPETPTDVRWVKIFTWRPNGDGINPLGNGLVEDCFIRTQDDSLYVNGRGIRRVVTWNDRNGSAFVLSAIPDRPLAIEDCDVIYARSTWPRASGGRVFNMRAEGGGAGGNGVVFRNIRVEDRRPTLQTFFILMKGLPPYTHGPIARKPGDLSGIVFENISIAAPSVVGEKDILWGAAGAEIKKITFDHVTVQGREIRSAGFFEKNEFVTDLRFK